MSKQIYYYAGIGLVFGAAVGGIAAMLLYGQTMNSTFIVFAGAGAGVGLVLGAIADMYKSKKEKS